jgi:histone H3/H4
MEVLVVTSKVKKYIKEKAKMNTSKDTIEVLSKSIQIQVDAAIEKATADGRKTVMAKDFEA